MTRCTRCGREIVGDAAVRNVASSTWSEGTGKGYVQRREFMHPECATALDHQNITTTLVTVVILGGLLLWIAKTFW